MSKVSVIIPVYNTEKYLERCLDSVIGQTLTDIEIICIDDCSTDGSYKILQKYADKDERIKIFQNEKNCGQSFSRNVGVDKSKGDWIQFLDSDDYLYDDALETLYNIAEENRLDVLKSGFVLKDDEQIKAIPVKNYSTNKKVYDGKEIFVEMTVNNVLLLSCVMHFIKREFIIRNSIKFVDGIWYEDILYTYYVTVNAKRCMYVSEHKYVYEKRVDSTTTMKQTDKHAYGLLVCLHDIFSNSFNQPEPIQFKYAVSKYLYEIYKRYKTVVNVSDENMQLFEFDESIKFDLEMLDSRIVDMDVLKNNIHKINNADRIIIYGGGVACKELLEILDYREISICGIAVTDVLKSKKVVMGHRVHNIDYYSKYGKDVLVLLAISKAKLNGADVLLKEKGFKNIIYMCK